MNYVSMSKIFEKYNKYNYVSDCDGGNLDSASLINIVDNSF